MSTQVFYGEHNINRDLMWITAEVLTLTEIRHCGVSTRGWCTTALGMSCFVPFLGQLPVGARTGSRSWLQFPYLFRDSCCSSLGIVVDERKLCIASLSSDLLT